MQAGASLAAVEHQLMSRTFGLSFSPGLEALYLSEIDERKRLPIVWGSLIGLVIFCAFGFFDPWLSPDLGDRGVLLRLLGVAPVCAVILCIYLIVPNPLTRDIGCASSFIICELATLYFMLASEAPLRIYWHFGVPLILIYVMTARIATFRSMLLSGCAGLPIYAAALWQVAEIPVPAKIFCCLVTAGMTSGAVVTGYFNERTLRRFYLFSLRDRLRSEELQDAAHRDPLTGLGNRRLLETQLPILWDEALAKGRPLAVAMLDIDRFKAYNDTYGHPAGDACLARVARLALGAAGEGGLGIRFGGEEMLFVFEGCDLAEAQARAEAIRIAVDQALIEHAGSSWNRVTVSIGVASTIPSDWPGGVKAAELLAAADVALYAAKTSGRNRIRPAPLIRDAESVHATPAIGPA